MRRSRVAPFTVPELVAVRVALRLQLDRLDDRPKGEQDQDWRFTRAATVCALSKVERRLTEGAVSESRADDFLTATLAEAAAIAGGGR